MFDRTGHLTDRAFAALVSGEDLPELTRLEIAEHLAYCDLCLQRCSDALSDEPLLSPPVSCEKPLLRRIRARTVGALTSRYATAAAAVTLALTLLWSDVSLPTTPDAEFSPANTLSETMSVWTQRCSDTLEDLWVNTESILGRFHLPDQWR